MNNYNAESIRSMDYMSHIRQYPGMYAGSKDSDAVHHLVKEILSNSIDEYLNGTCTKISVTVDKEKNRISILDNGRGIPHGVHPSGCSTLQATYGIERTGGKFDNATGKSGYNTSGGEHGTGAKVTNALSKKLITATYREGYAEEVEFAKGEFVNYRKFNCDKDRTGLYTEFYPDEEIFGEEVFFNIDRIKKMLREFSFLSKNLTFSFSAEEGEVESFCSKNGLLDYLNYLNKKELICDPMYFYAEEGTFSVEVAMGYNTTYGNIVKLYTNNIPNESGNHLTGFKTALTSCINNYAREKKLLKDKDENFTGADLEEGQILILNFKMIDPVFQGQAKEKLTSTEGRTMVQKLATVEINNWLNANPSKAKAIINKALLAKKARASAKKAKDSVRKLGEGKTKRVLMPDKLSDASSKERNKCELFLVEGDSAGGNAKDGRDRATQAILSLRGKVLNTSKVELSKALENEEIKAILVALGVDTVSGKLVVNPDKLRYGKLIFMTDADVDGGHIRTLLLTMLWNLIPEIFELGLVYSAVPPLYRIIKTNENIYLEDDAALEEYRSKHAGEKYELARFKGLGEMSAEQLWDTTMNPETRTLRKLTITDMQETEKLFNDLMGTAVQPRKDFIEANANYAELDI